ncbi:hypothetical protein [Mangrovibacterium lignilyticum]|uniref:hypothetical protein n=1 Tax=Mangrovibacterium lignilyticum TaxID=2668052 RepID=UPI0013D16701|nr:hypothetical protein [Mangrovibacterium lignilyticum]
MSANFHFSMGTLTQRGDRVNDLMLRDAAQFALRGYDEIFRTNFASKLTNFRELPSDNYWLAQQTLKTDAKNKANSTVVDLLVSLRYRCKHALGEKSVEYKGLRFNQLKDIKSPDLIVLANHICLTCNEMLDKLAARNITAVTLDEIGAATAVLDNAIDDQKEAMSTREAKTIERENTANELYALISEICEAGKDIWNGLNEAYYNDYVIYGSQDPIEEDEEVQEETL